MTDWLAEFDEPTLGAADWLAEFDEPALDARAAGAGAGDAGAGAAGDEPGLDDDSGSSNAVQNAGNDTEAK